MRLVAVWKRHFLGLEAAVVLALVSFFAIWYYQFDGVSHISVLLSGNRANLYKTLATISATLLGFSLTSVSIAIGLVPREQLSLVRGSKHYSTLWKVFMHAIYSLGALTIWALVSLVADKDSAPVPWVVIPTLMFFGLSLFRVLRMVWVFKNLIQIVTQEPSH